MTVWVVGIVTLVVFVLLLAFVPHELVAPRDEAGEFTAFGVDQPGQSRFVGVLPCADCEGIRTELVLRADGSFTIEQNYLGKIAMPPYYQIGNWATLRGTAWDMKATIYKTNHDRLQGFRYYYLLPEGDLQLLDEAQNKLEPAANYTLERQ